MIYEKNPNEFSEFLERQLKSYKKKVILLLERIGKKCVNEARTNGDYLDQTGNLRSSIGYAIVEDGKIVSISDFNVVKQGSHGKKEGSDFAKEIAKEYAKGIVLIVVAGMNYAAYVETRRNVLTSSELLAKREVPRLLAKLKV